MQRNARDWLSLAKHDNDALVNGDGYASQDFSDVQDDDETPGGELSMGNDIQIAIVRPRNFRDAATVGDYYRHEIPVIINLEDMDKADATRIIDFVSGLILGLCGDLERISRRTFLLVPAGSTIITTHDGLTEEGFFNQALWLVNGSLALPVGRTRMTMISRTKGHCHRAGFHPSSRELCQGFGVKIAMASSAPTRPTAAVLSILTRFALLLTVPPLYVSSGHHKSRPDSPAQLVWAPRGTAGAIAATGGFGAATAFSPATGAAIRTAGRPRSGT
ncbi:MAG TPA: cell division protein SepF [Trebonia sp.]